jgi:ribosomal protein S18 acetylase RimI-like enzyme
MERIVFNILDKSFLQNHVVDFIDMCQRNMENEYWNKDNFLAELPGKWKYSFVVTNNPGAVMGFIIASDKSSSIHIHKFVVDKPYQRSGIGSQMVNHLLDQTARPLTLKVRKDNTQAIEFYKRHGFVVNDQKQESYSMIRQMIV